MSARIHPVDVETCDSASLHEAASWLQDGRIIAYPTDTFYGLAVDPTLERAVEGLFDLKGRDSRVAVPLVAASIEQVVALCGPLSRNSAALAEQFWPGPLSLVLNAPSSMARAVHAGLGTIAIRVPDHRVARALAEAAGVPVTATSANRSGSAPAREIAQLGSIADDDRVLVIDGGPTAGGAPSTIVDARGAHPVLVRDGAIAWMRVLEFLKR